MDLSAKDFFSSKSPAVKYFSSPIKLGRVLEIDTVDTAERYLGIRIKDISEETTGVAFPLFIHTGYVPEVGSIIAYIEIAGKMWYFPFPVNYSNRLQSYGELNASVTLDELKRSRIYLTTGSLFLNGKGQQALVFDEEGNVALTCYSAEATGKPAVLYDEENAPYGFYGKVRGDEVSLKSYKVSFQGVNVPEKSSGFVIKLRADSLHLLQRERILVTARRLHLATIEEAIMGSEKTFRISSSDVFIRGDRIKMGAVDSASENVLLGKSFNNFMVKMLRKFAQEFSKMGGPGVPPAVAFAAANLASFCLSAAIELSSQKYLSEKVYVSK